jgi:predicted permease
MIVYVWMLSCMGWKSPSGFTINTIETKYENNENADKQRDFKVILRVFSNPAVLALLEII